MLKRPRDCPDRFRYYEGGVEMGRINSVDIGGYIMGVEIFEQFRGKGHGKKMMSELLEWMRAKKFKSASLTTSARNMPAIKVYTFVGFNIDKVDGYCLSMSRRI